PRVSVATTLARSQRDITVLEGYIANSQTLGVKHQHFIGEVVMLRLFSILEQGISEFALKLACGAFYSNGAAPIRLQNCRSIDDAFAKMTTIGRPTPKAPKWTKAKFVRQTIQYVLDVNDRYCVEV